jgi:hypothetical protein
MPGVNLLLVRTYTQSSQASFFSQSFSIFPRPGYSALITLDLKDLVAETALSMSMTA